MVGLGRSFTIDFHLSKELILSLLTAKPTAVRRYHAYAKSGKKKEEKRTKIN